MPQATEIRPGPAPRPRGVLGLVKGVPVSHILPFSSFFFLFVVFLHFTFLTGGKLGTPCDPRIEIQIDLKVNFFPHRFVHGLFMFFDLIFGPFFNDFSMFFA